jgi:hypothetical protein
MKSRPNILRTYTLHTKNIETGELTYIPTDNGFTLDDLLSFMELYVDKENVLQISCDFSIMNDENPRHGISLLG